jgi:hypothetical protein
VKHLAPKPWSILCLFTSTLAWLIAACAATGPEVARQHLWWSGLGPVIPHDTFPGDCSLCHAGQDWQTLRADFRFDHALEAGLPLEGAHAQARCLRCHNDRGPAETFARAGCAGCHEDVHAGRLGNDCTSCHEQQTWRAIGQHVLHQRTRFPLTGAHAVTACVRCHPSSIAGSYTPVDTECVSCHQSDLAQATNPNHVGLGWVDRCDRCHLPRTWQQAEIND